MSNNSALTICYKRIGRFGSPLQRRCSTSCRQITSEERSKAVPIFCFISIMSIYRKALGRGAMQLSRNAKVATTPTSVFQRSFSTILETREIGEEARYIRNIEAQNKAEIRANIERILALEDGHAEKTDLVQMLGLKPALS